MMTMSYINWFRKCSFSWPVGGKASVKSNVPYAKEARPLCQRQRLVAIGNAAGNGPADDLFSCGRPTAIARFVVPIIVDPMNRMRETRPISHVTIERSVRFSPSVADADAPTSIPYVGGHSRIAATPLHASPDAVCGVPVGMRCVTVGDRPVHARSALMAEFRTPKVRCRDRVRVAACTPAKPSALAKIAKHKLLSEHLVSEVLLSWWDCGKLLLSHGAFSPIRRDVVRVAWGRNPHVSHFIIHTFGTRFNTIFLGNTHGGMV